MFLVCSDFVSVSKISSSTFLNLINRQTNEQRDVENIDSLAE